MDKQAKDSSFTSFGIGVGIMALVLAGGLLFQPDRQQPQFVDRPATESSDSSADGQPDESVSGAPPSSAAPTAPAEEQSAGPISVPKGTLTKASFSALVIGHSKAEIRAAFGSPSNSSSFGGTDTWFYHADILPITDPEAGLVLSSVGITFNSEGVSTGFYW